VHIGAYRDCALAEEIPLDAQIAAALEFAFQLHAPADSDVTPHIKRPHAADICAAAQVFTGNNAAATADAAAGNNAAAGAQDGVDVDMAMHLERAGEDNRLGLNGINAQHR